MQRRGNIQAPRAKLQRAANLQTPKRCRGLWTLNVESSLVLGSWRLDLFSSRQQPRAHRRNQISIAAEKLVERVLGRAVPEELRWTHAVFIVGANKVREFRTQFV